jgi:uncharacterized protein YndB with AHSA1/START domain
MTTEYRGSAAEVQPRWRGSLGRAPGFFAAASAEELRPGMCGLICNQYVAYVGATIQRRSAMQERQIAAKAEMLIRRPAAQVFQAFIDPAVTSRFWFSRGSGKLEAGKSVRWDWDMYGFSVDVRVKDLVPEQRLLVEWSAYGPASDIEWVFTARADGTTFVRVVNSGFAGNREEQWQLAVGATEGFSFVLAGAKALLEQGVQLNLVPDRFPDGLPKG